MICPNCEHHNPAGSGFCLNCGQRIAQFCSYCGNQLPLSAKFCNRCGRPVGSGSEDYLDDSFGRPTHRTADTAEFEDLSQVNTHKQAHETDHLSQYIPKELLAKMEALSGAGTMAGERRVVTMLFCDVKGSTAASEQFDPEDWTEIINGAFELMIRPVYQYKGTVARLMGDGLLAFFGAPIAHEDDPQRAILAALEIVHGIKAQRQEVEKRWGIEIDVRVGINTGMVVVGTVGSDLRLEYTAMGDAINLAARMEQTAEPGSVQIAHDTYRLVSSLFDIEELGGIEVKGKAEPVLAYRVLGRKVTAEQLRDTAGIRVEAVGRDRESDILLDALSGLGQGIGKIVCVIGEAGLGKSRLIHDVKILSEDEELPVNWQETGSLSFETTNPYGLFHRLIRRDYGIAANEAAVTAREKLAPLWESFDGEEQDRARQVFETLFGLSGEEGSPRLQGESFKRLLFSTMVDLWQRKYSDQPALLVFDDLHWSDPASIELLLHLFPLVEKVPLLLLCAFRPERTAASWQIKVTADDRYHQLYSEIFMRPLSKAQSYKLVKRLVADSDLPDALLANIWERSGGNPLFVEEVVRSLKETGMLKRVNREGEEEIGVAWRVESGVTTFDIPNSLHALLAARVDQLEEDAQGTLQLASVIGQSFNERTITAVAAHSALERQALDSQLSGLLRTGLLEIVTRIPEIEYRFSNPLTREVIYSGILFKRRRAFHQQVAEALERLYPEQQAKIALELGYHYRQAQEYEQALLHYTRAADFASQLFANTEAAQYYARAIACTVEIDLGSAETADLYISRGRALELDNQYEEALATYDTLDALAQEREDNVLELASLMAHAVMYATRMPLFDTDRAEAVGLEALALAREIKDEAAESRILWILMMAESEAQGGRPQKAVDLGEASLALARQQNLPEQMAYTLNNLVPVYSNVGNMARAVEVGLEARGLWDELGNQPMLADINNLMALTYLLKGQYDAALDRFKDGYEIGKSIANPWSRAGSLVAAGTVYLDLGRIDLALASFDEYRVLSRQTGSAYNIGLSGTTLSRVYCELGMYEKAVQDCHLILADSPDLPEGVRQMIYDQLARSYARLGDIGLAEEALSRGTAADDSDNVLKAFLPREDLIGTAEIALAGKAYDRALAAADRQAARVELHAYFGYLAEPLFLKGEALIGLERTAEAFEALSQARTVAMELGMQRMLWRILGRIGEIEEGFGNLAKAEALRKEALAIVSTLAGHIGDEDLRHSFLARADVLEVTAGV